MHFRAVIPDGVKAGETVRVMANNIPLNVKIPKSLKTGDEFVFQISEEELARAANGAAAAKATGVGGNGGGPTQSGSKIKDRSSSSSKKPAAGGEAVTPLLVDAEPASKKISSSAVLPAMVSGAGSGSGSAGNPYLEFGAALCIGVLIGLSIVFGFFLGVLAVTEPLGPNGLPLSHGDGGPATQQRRATNGGAAKNIVGASNKAGSAAATTSASARKVLKSVLNGAAAGGKKRNGIMNRNKSKS